MATKQPASNDGHHLAFNDGHQLAFNDGYRLASTGRQ
jgi:hypothetical protein